MSMSLSERIPDDQARLAARLALDGLAPLCALAVDASRVAVLEPLVVMLLRQGEQLARTTEPDVEPFFVGVAARAPVDAP